MVKPSADKAPSQPIDWYAVLGVAPDASLETIRVAWRGLARTWHPDHAGNGPEARDRFEAIQRAYEVVGADEPRFAYDGVRRAYADCVAPLPAGLVERYIGVRKPEAAVGRNRLYRLTVSSADAITGHRYEIDLPDSVPCRPCGGTGVGALGRPVLCDGCGGRCYSVVRPVLRAVGEPCARCHAAGWVPDRPCAACGGTGAVPGARTVVVHVPAGVADRAQIRAAGHGEAAVGSGARGDLIVSIEIEDARYRVRGDDWEATEAIPFWKALAGGAWTVTTPWGERVIKVPPGTRDGERLCLSGLGVAKRGDGYLKVAYTWPESLTAAEADRLVAWGEALSGGLHTKTTERGS